MYVEVAWRGLSELVKVLWNLVLEIRRRGWGSGCLLFEVKR